MLNVHLKKRQCSWYWCSSFPLLLRLHCCHVRLKLPQYTWLGSIIFRVAANPSSSQCKIRPLFEQQRICNLDCESRLTILVLSVQQIVPDKQTLCPEDLYNILYFFTLPNFTWTASYISDSKTLNWVPRLFVLSVNVVYFLSTLSRRECSFTQHRVMK